MIPTIGMKGSFTLGAPYDTLAGPEVVLEVVAIRSILEITASNEDPLNNIYLASGDIAASFQADIAANEPIVTFRTDADNYLYVPSNKVMSDAKQSGHKYIEKTVMFNIGYLPEGIDLTGAIANAAASIKDAIGVAPAIKTVNTSETLFVPDTKHLTLAATRTASITTNKSYRTLYEELLVVNNAQKQFITNIETVYKTTGIGL